MSDLVSNFHVIFFSIKNKPSNKIMFVFHTFCYFIFFSFTLHIYYTRLSKSYENVSNRPSRLARSIKQDTNWIVFQKNDYRRTDEVKKDRKQFQRTDEIVYERLDGGKKGE